MQDAMPKCENGGNTQKFYKMKMKMMMMMVILVAALSACNKDNTTPSSQTVATTSLPTKATDYIYNNYPDATIDYVVTISNSPAAYLVTLNTTEELAFNTTGNYLGEGSLFRHGHHGGDTTHCGGGHHGGGHHGGGIPVDSLPEAIKDYITAYYSGYTLRHAEMDSLCPDGLVTEVMICQPSAEPVKLIFDATNTFLLYANRMRYADAPQAVKDFITSGYAVYTASNKAEKFTMADGSFQYMIYLKNNPERKKVRVMEDGTLVCEN
jgi:hypothetical protein